MKVAIDTRDVAGLSVMTALLDAMGGSTEFSIHVPQGNKYKPHCGAKQKEKNLKRMERKP